MSRRTSPFKSIPPIKNARRLSNVTSFASVLSGGLGASNGTVTGCQNFLERSKIQRSCPNFSCHGHCPNLMREKKYIQSPFLCSVPTKQHHDWVVGESGSKTCRTSRASWRIGRVYRFQQLKFESGCVQEPSFRVNGGASDVCTSCVRNECEK